MPRLLLHDTLPTANLVEPLRQQWVDHQIDLEFRQGLRAGEIESDVFALLPAPEFTLLTSSHRLVPDIAVVDTQQSAIAMRTPVRPDVIESTDVVLYECSATAELLARALIWPFFGITCQEWRTSPDGEAQITIVEGALALQDPEAGQALDLGRSWFVMTGMPLVTHLLVAPSDADRSEHAAVADALRRSAAESHNRRRQLRLLLDERYGVERERLVTYLTGQRYLLDESDREALVALYVRGAGGSSYLPLTRPPFAGQSEPE